MNKIQQLANDLGCTEWQAKYMLEKSRRKGEYKAKPRKNKTPEDLEQLDVVVTPDSTSDYGWKITMKGRVRPIWVAKGTQYKDGGCKYYPAVTINYNNKQSLYSLAAIIWLGYLKKDIPAGYVIDHIDNDSFNNDISNLQMLTIRENIDKNPSKKVQYKQELEIQASKYDMTPEEYARVLERPCMT